MVPPDVIDVFLGLVLLFALLVPRVGLLPRLGDMDGSVGGNSNEKWSNEVLDMCYYY